MSQKLTKAASIAVLGLVIAVSQLPAAISINVSAEKLKDPGGYDMAVSGILVLVGSTTDAIFSGPTDSSFVQDDDAVVAIWDIANDGGNTPGAFLGGTGSVSLGGAWDAGDPLAIYWFPTLTAANNIDDTVPSAAIPYGMFRVESGNPDGTDDWVTPADGTIGYNLKFITTDATALEPGGGSSDAADGEAGLFTPGAGPAAPSGVAGVADGLAIGVSWTDNASDETGYRVERSLDGSDNWSVLGEVGAGITAYNDDSVEGSTSYQYRVLALRGPSQSDYETSDAVESSAASARFTNLSTRALVETGDNILIASFQLSGGPLRVYSRVAGPDLAGAGITNFLSDPIMELVRVSDNTIIASNDNWKVNAVDQSSQQADIESTFIPPADDAESALIANLDTPGLYSIVVRGVGDVTGFANVELYEFPDPGEANPGKLTNLSTRARVGTGDDILIASFQVSGDAPQRIYSRVAGPALAGAGITEFLADPDLELRRFSDNALLSSNDNWKINAADNSSQEAEITATFIPPANDVESALVATLAQNALYSLIIRGVADGEGFANAEVYDYPE